MARGQIVCMVCLTIGVLVSIVLSSITIARAQPCADCDARCELCAGDQCRRWADETEQCYNATVSRGTNFGCANTLAAFDCITCNSTRRGSTFANPLPDNDWYRFHVTDTNATFLCASGSADAFCFFYRGFGNCPSGIVGRPIVCPSNSSEHCWLAESMPAGTYYLRVIPRAGVSFPCPAATVTYSLQLTCGGGALVPNAVTDVSWAAFAL